MTGNPQQTLTGSSIKGRFPCTVAEIISTSAYTRKRDFLCTLLGCIHQMCYVGVPCKLTQDPYTDKFTCRATINCILKCFRHCQISIPHCMVINLTSFSANKFDNYYIPGVKKIVQCKFYYSRTTY